MGKGASFKRIVAVRNYSINTIMRKKQTEGERYRQRVKDMEFSGVK